MGAEGFMANEHRGVVKREYGIGAHPSRELGDCGEARSKVMLGGRHLDGLDPRVTAQGRVARRPTEGDDIVAAIEQAHGDLRGG